MATKRTRLETPPHVKRFILRLRDPAPTDAIRGQISMQLHPRILILENWFNNDLRLTIDRDIDNIEISRAVETALGGPANLNPWRMAVTW